MHITKLNNAALIVATQHTTIAIDVGKDVPVVDVDALTVDAVFVSHVHPDHFDRANLERLGRPVYASREAYEALATSPLSVTDLVPGDRVRIGDLEVLARVVDHGPISAPIVNLGFEISDGLHRIWFAGDIALDTEPLPTGPVNAVLVPVGGGKVFEPAAAVAYASQFPGATIVPIHFEYSLTTFLEFCNLATAAGLPLLPLGNRESAIVPTLTGVAG